MRRFLSLSLLAAGAILAGGHFSEASAQGRDPFSQPAWKKTNTPRAVNPNAVKKTPPPVLPVAAPAIETRIAYYKQLRESAASSGMPIPKVTSVLTLEELTVTGIFRTPRGYAAMVEATPIKLSYTIYPGEKFFDGQLVAIEENRLTFRRVVKMSNGKFVSSVENKGMRQYAMPEATQPNAPVEASSAQKTETAANTNAAPNAAAPTETAPTAPVTAAQTAPTASAPSKIVSPVDEMNSQPAEKPQDSVKDKNSKKGKKPAKVAKKS